MRKLWHKLYQLFTWKDPLWIAVPAHDPFSSTTHGEQHIEFVSRHAIAETGLICPTCYNEVAPLGDYRLVRHCRLGDVIKCNGTRHMQDNEFTCGKFLVASPDTEHGDHLLYDKVPKADRAALFHHFVRILEGDAARRKYGNDITLVDGEMIATPVVIPAKVKLPTLALKAGQVWQTDDGRLVSILRVQENSTDIHLQAMDGWAWGTFANEPPVDWNIDPTGLVRHTMRDPTLHDRVRLLHEVRPN